MVEKAEKRVVLLLNNERLPVQGRISDGVTDSRVMKVRPTSEGSHLLLSCG